MASAVVTGLLFVGIMCFMDYWLDGNFQSLYSYLFQGVLFGTLFGFGFPYLTEKLGKGFTSSIGKNIRPELTNDEEIEIEGPVNLFRGLEGVGGKMFLTNKKIIFKSHKINVQKGQTDIEYLNIKELTKQKTAKLIDNGIKIKTNDGKEYDFVVNGRAMWMEKLNEKIK